MIVVIHYDSCRETVQLVAAAMMLRNETRAEYRARLLPQVQDHAAACVDHPEYMIWDDWIERGIAYDEANDELYQIVRLPIAMTIPRAHPEMDRLEIVSAERAVERAKRWRKAGEEMRARRRAAEEAGLPWRGRRADRPPFASGFDVAVAAASIGSPINLDDYDWEKAEYHTLPDHVLEEALYGPADHDPATVDELLALIDQAERGEVTTVTGMTPEERRTALWGDFALPLTPVARAHLQDLRAQADAFAQLPVRKMTREECIAFLDAAPVRHDPATVARLVETVADLNPDNLVTVTGMTREEKLRSFFGDDDNG